MDLLEEVIEHAVLDDALSEEEVLQLRTYRSKPTGTEMKELARILHIMGCVPDCNLSSDGWIENVNMVVDVLWPKSR